VLSPFSLSIMSLKLAFKRYKAKEDEKGNDDNDQKPEVKERSPSPPPSSGSEGSVSSNSSDVVGNSPDSSIPQSLVSQPTHRWVNYRFHLKSETKDRSHLLKIVHRSVAANLPPSVDFSNLVPYVADQSELGSCASEAACYLMKIWEMKQQPSSAQRPAILPFDPSPMFQYWNARVLVEGDPVDQDTGTTIYDSISATKRYGICSLTSWAYDISKFAVQPPENCYLEAAKHKSSSLFAIPQQLTSLKSYLSQRIPIMAGFQLYQSFQSDAVAASGMVPLPGPNEPYLGGHALVLVAYDDAKSLFKFVNSYSGSWGQSGFGYFPYAYVLNMQLASQFYAISGLAFTS